MELGGAAPAERREVCGGAVVEPEPSLCPRSESWRRDGWGEHRRGELSVPRVGCPRAKCPPRGVPGVRVSPVSLAWGVRGESVPGVPCVGVPGVRVSPYLNCVGCPGSLVSPAWGAWWLSIPVWGSWGPWCPLRGVSRVPGVPCVGCPAGQHPCVGFLGFPGVPCMGSLGSLCPLHGMPGIPAPHLAAQSATTSTIPVPVRWGAIRYVGTHRPPSPPRCSRSPPRGWAPSPQAAAGQGRRADALPKAIVLTAVPVSVPAVSVQF